MLEAINHQIRAAGSERTTLPPPPTEYDTLNPVRLDHISKDQQGVQLHYASEPIMQLTIRMILLLRDEEIEELFSEDLPFTVFTVPSAYVGLFFYK
jgi:hypothetical protein